MIGPLPSQIAWRHVGVRAGFEVCFAGEVGGGWGFAGTTSALEDGLAWAVTYELTVDPAGWATRRARVHARTVAGERAVEVATDGAGGWWVDGRRAVELDGCLDIDLASSVLTNAFPVRRLGMAVGEGADAPGVYVRAEDLRVERLEQRYVRLDDEGTQRRYRYTAPAFDFTCVLAYDEAGLLLDYPGIAVRAA